jgi:hypothetical protein
MRSAGIRMVQVQESNGSPFSGAVNVEMGLASTLAINSL